MTATQDELKRQAAARAVEEIASGMAVGLGTGSTAAHMVRLLGAALKSGRLSNIRGLPTSEATARLATELGIPLTDLAETPRLDLTIDGADEVDPDLQLIKGLGGALLREKIVAASSARLVIITDDSKRVPRLGSRAPLPVEVIPFAAAPVTAALEKLGARVTLRRGGDGTPFRTDENNVILDARFEPIADPRALDLALCRVPGIVEHGLFLDLADTVIFAGAGGIEVLRR
jgi:ribose 5-phosphate isomerase A